ncbi:MAG: FAD-binding oxidoreductase [Archaeoglobi archaeon]|nr:FAD-binding oxidoreductase [Archaeoglobi archaeon]
MDIYRALVDIVGEEFVSRNEEELYIYSRDSGLTEREKPDFVVMPGSAEEVQKIVLLANKYKIPLTPVGASLTLSGLAVPIRRGIVVDLRRMDRIIEVNRLGRYAVIEPGVTQGKLKAFLEKNYPDLCHSMPDAPPSATVVGNILIHGQGNLSQLYGFNSTMVTGLEIVLPTGKMCRIGSCSLSPYWFAVEPLPYLAGIFLGWFGTTGIITKLGLRLYPRKRLRDIEVFVLDDPEKVADVVYRITHTEMAEDVITMEQPYPMMFRDVVFVQIYFNGDSEEEIEFKRKMLWNSVMDYIRSRDGGFMFLTPDAQEDFLEKPASSVTRFADVMKGGGFVYCGAIIPVEKFAEALRKLKEIAKRHETTYGHVGRIVGRGHCMMFSFSFPFNRADRASMERAKEALHESYLATLELGGIPWKPELFAQKMILERMDKNAAELMKQIRGLLDPNGIMNPGNWEVEP